MKRCLLALAIGLMLAGAASNAAAIVGIDFNGQAILPGGIGSELVLYSIVTNNGVVPTPIPFDFDNYEYTLVVTTLILIAEDGIAQDYMNGTITVYEDDGSPADYDNPGSFVDGEAILIAELNPLHRNGAIPNLVDGNFNGTSNWIGGTRIDELAIEFRNDRPFQGGISMQPGDALPGYDENWDGFITWPDTVPVDGESWGALKGIFQGR